MKRTAYRQQKYSRGREDLSVMAPKLIKFQIWPNRILATALGLMELVPSTHSRLAH
jgi:hypothetical protein